MSSKNAGCNEIQTLLCPPRQLDMEDIKCPQFVDFTVPETFDMFDGADFCFENFVLGEENVADLNNNDHFSNMLNLNLLAVENCSTKKENKTTPVDQVKRKSIETSKPNLKAKPETPIYSGVKFLPKKSATKFSSNTQSKTPNGLANTCSKIPLSSSSRNLKLEKK